MREAANAAQLRRNMESLDLVLIPEMVWELCTQDVIVMERMNGVPISQAQRLSDAGVDIKKLARDGVTIFFTQVFRDGFFHADMHPGNIQVSIAPETFGRYISLDFGIVGTLTELDKDYLAQNFIAFFHRDYKRVAELHVESGWVPPQTRIDELEGAIRAVCEPQFDRPLKDISLGQVLLRLFQTSRRFNVEIQPQLVLLQKTLLNVEGLGRELDPELDLWSTAKPFLERWMEEQVGWQGFVEQLQKEAPRYVHLLPQLPRLLHGALQPQQGRAATDRWRRSSSSSAAPTGCSRGSSTPRSASCSGWSRCSCCCGCSERRRRGRSAEIYTVGLSFSEVRRMPIYAYRCTTCGHAQDVLRKISDPPLSVCPACGAATFAKQVTAAGFQLKGSGWYVTDFRGDRKAAASQPKANAAGKAPDGETRPANGDAKRGEAARPRDERGTRKPAAAPAKSEPAPAAAPALDCGAPPSTPDKSRA